jgi:hypothetical protein
VKEKPMRRRAKPARLPVALKSRKNRAPTVRDLEKRLAEALKREADALEQQTATAEILRVISSSPTDVQPVFDAIAAKALDLCRAKTSTVFRFDGVLVHLVAGHSLSPGRNRVPSTGLSDASGSRIGRNPVRY